MIRNERGIALVVTLLVVALLAITVVEFTYSVEIDQHMARAALSGLQASLLARSGIHLGEALLLHDSEAQYDAFTEEWCPSHDQLQDGERPSCSFDVANSQIVVPDNMRLRVQILDEGSKLNLNLTRPLQPAQWRAAKNNPNSVQPFQAWQSALGTLLAGRGVDNAVAESVADYWDRLFELKYGAANQANQTPGVPTPGAPGPTPTPGAVTIDDFPSLDDASIIPGLTPSVLRRMRPVMTAIDARRQGQVNINTASREVLNAIIGDGGIVDGVISQRQTAPLQGQDIGRLLAGVNQQDPEKRFVRSMVGVRSAFFLIRASAIINPNPLTGRGGISRSAAMLVRRDPKPGVAPNAPPGTPRWTLTRLDWQKEGGAALFQQRVEQTPGSMDETSASDAF